MPKEQPSPAEVAEVAQACTRCLANGSPSPRADRIVVLLADCLDGELTIASSGDGKIVLCKGDSLFAPASDGGLAARGHGTVVQADVP